jgi:membrane-associated phospholipid phosphatase
MLVRHGRHRITKIFGVAYPLILSFDVMVTANHYLLDVIGGGLVMAVAYGAVRLLARAGIVTFPHPEAGNLTPAAEPTPA